MRSCRPVFVALGIANLIALHTASAQLRPTALPVAGLTREQQHAFEQGGIAFSKIYGVAEGLGPLFNDQSCMACHGIMAGSSNRINTRFGRREDHLFDPLERLGGSLVQSRGIGTIPTADGNVHFSGEGVPDQANTVTVRRTPTLQGLGFVDAVPDATWLAIAEAQLVADPSTAGRVHRVFDTATGAVAVGKFGWKAQVATLRRFAGDALVNELGITNPEFPHEPCPQGDCAALAFNPAPALNDDGAAVTALTDFMTMLAAPPRGAIPSQVAVGEAVFREIGCATCHLPVLETGPSAIAALDHAIFHPYSDFLLHDMGGLGDGIAQGDATGREMRTAPLWGLGTKTLFLHDGNAPRLSEAILRHDGQGRASRDRFAGLEPARLTTLLAFLKSL
jgi:CxxC motif-containing protein (DUF1111 family)